MNPDENWEAYFGQRGLQVVLKVDEADQLYQDECKLASYLIETSYLFENGGDTYTIRFSHCGEKQPWR